MSDNKRIIDELTEEELLALANGASVDQVIEKISEAGKFIHAKGIRDGKVKIRAFIVYYLYREWRGFRNKKQSKLYFFRDFSKYFTSHRDKDGAFYLLNPKPFDLSKDNYWIVRSEIRNEKAKK